MVKDPPANAGDLRDGGLIPGLGRSLGVGHGNPFQYSCLDSPKDRGAWWAIVHRVTKSQTQLKRLGMHMHALFYPCSRIFKNQVFFWCRWVFIAALRLSLVVSRGCSWWWCVDFLLRWLLLLQSTGSRTRKLSSEALGLSCSSACGILVSRPGTEPMPLHWQVDSYPLYHQGSPPCSHTGGILPLNFQPRKDTRSHMCHFQEKSVHDNWW